jgi:hypothetical protein
MTALGINRRVVVAFALLALSCAPPASRRTPIPDDPVDDAGVEDGGGGTGGTGGITPPPPQADDAGGAGGTPGPILLDAARPADAPPAPRDAGSDARDAAPDRAAADTRPAPDSAPADRPPAAPRTALIIAASSSLVPVDDVLRRRMEAAGLTVTVTTPAAVSAGDAAGKGLVIISATIDSPMLGTKLRDVTVPVLSMEPNIMDEMGMSAAAVTVGAQTELTIASAESPLAGGLQGNVTVYTAAASVVTGTPGPGAQVVATVVGNPAQAAIYAYASGAALVGGTPAAGKRIAFFVNDNQVGISLAAGGLTLFDAAVGWALSP